ncbi:sodium:solute symporter family transporter, partial [Streptomyces griseorubiginosus]
MSKQGNFQKSMSLFDLILIGMGAIFGSAWLFAVSNVASKAGPSGAFSWILGGAIILLIGLVYAELGAALPRTGGIIRYPVYSHGHLVGYLISFVTTQMVGAGSLVALLLGGTSEAAQSWTVIGVGALMVIYVSLGGMRATTWIQIVKAVLLLGGTVALTVLVLVRLPAISISCCSRRRNAVATAGRSWRRAWRPRPRNWAGALRLRRPGTRARARHSGAAAHR